MSIKYDHDHENEVVLFAETNFRNQKRRFGIKTDDRRRHFYCLGKTGMGKSTLLENLIIADIKAGHGVGVVDPHGDLADKLLDYIPSYRVNDVIYFNPADMEWPIGFNILETIDPAHKHLVASGLMGVFKKIWPDVWSARMEYILNNSLLALLDYPGSTLLGINRLLVDKEFRKRVISRIENPVVKAFWVDEYANYNERFRTEAIAPIQNKVGQFLSSSIIRNIVAQVKSTINMRQVMDEGKIFIMNLSKGRIGEDSSRLLGGMLVTRLQLAAMERVDILEEDRRDFYLYVDEFQNFATESFASILSEARKYRLNLTIAHQYIEQLDEKVTPAVFGNVGTIICFRVGAADAEFLINEFTPQFVEEDLVNLKKFDVYLKLMIDGMASKPFSATTLMPLAVREGNREKIIRLSREHYAEPKESIEAKVLRWSGMESVGVKNEEEDGETNEKRDIPVLPTIKVTTFRANPSEQSQAAAPVSRPSFKTPFQTQNPQINIKETQTVVKIESSAKPISLGEALKQKPVYLKGGRPRSNQPFDTRFSQSPPTLSKFQPKSLAPEKIKEESFKQDKPLPSPQQPPEDDSKELKSGETVIFEE
ncbi:MAG: type IV secretion system DNA-binding domain-containing protein [bacterium]|nr:type IV secretion system DNA-binding domain-containing protein [bacterium]